MNARYVVIVGGNCYVRTSPSTSGEQLGVAFEGNKLEYQGQDSSDGWHKVIYRKHDGWVSGRYSRLED